MTKYSEDKSHEAVITAYKPELLKAFKELFKAEKGEARPRAWVYIEDPFICGFLIGAGYLRLDDNTPSTTDDLYVWITDAGEQLYARLKGVKVEQDAEQPKQPEQRPTDGNTQ